MPLHARPLTDSERKQVEKLVRSADAVTHRRARIVLLSTAGRRVAEVIAATGLCESTIRTTLRAFNRTGLVSLPRRKAKGAQRRLDETGRAALLELLHTPPSTFGIESALWTAPDLARVAKEQGLAEQLSPDTVRREIRRSGKSWKRAKRWTTSPDPDYQRKKGRSSV
jgi:transposase